ncbi:LPS-assembly protein LptD [bacterium]|nr:LPS-assembly protein LptD [bacterium]
MTKGSGSQNLKYVAVSLSLLIASNSALVPAWAAASKSDKPSGTLLLPLTPKIDQNDVEPISPQAVPASQSQRQSYSQAASQTSSQSTSLTPAILQPEAPQIDTSVSGAPDKVAPESSDTSSMLEASATADDLQLSEMDSAVSEDTTLKGTIQIVADDTEYDQEKNTFLGTGNAVAIIGGQNSKLEADMILYDQNSQTIDARGHVKILRTGQVTTGSAFKFKVNSDEYLITSPDTELNGTQVIARGAYGTNRGMIFKNGTLDNPTPFHLGKNMLYGPQSSVTDIMDKIQHPDAYLTDKPSFVFKARKMIYEKYKESGNLTVLGGRLQFARFSVPVPKFVATVGQDNNIMFPVTPMLSSNIQSGGINVGPSFNSAMGKTGKFNWAPMVQFGGRTTSGTTGGSGIGLSGQVGYSNNRFSTHLAYGSVSNLLVADFKSQLTKGTLFQAGINRFQNDGLYGFRRARLIAEVVNNKAIGNIPYLSSLNFRSSAGWAQDNPQLINATPGMAALYGGTTQNTTLTSAFRLQEQITAVSQPLFSLGNEKYGARGYIFGGLALGAYSTGDARAMGQIGPTVQFRADRFTFSTNYTQSAVRGSSPFYFDQFLQGNKSANIQGDVKINKWLTVGGGYGYNIDSKLPYSKSISAAIGPQDFKVLLSRNMIQGINRFGFDIIYGQPIPFTKLVLKGAPDHGQMSGIQ